MPSTTATTATRARGQSPASTAGVSATTLATRPMMPGGSPASTSSAKASAPPGSRSRRSRPRRALQRPRPPRRRPRRRRRGWPRHTRGRTRRTRAGPSALSAATGSTTQPAWATVDQASRRVDSVWRSAMTLPSSIEAAASMPSTMPTDPVSTAAPARAWPTTSRAASGRDLRRAGERGGGAEVGGGVGLRGPRVEGHQRELEAEPGRAAPSRRARAPPGVRGRPTRGHGVGGERRRRRWR